MGVEPAAGVDQVRPAVDRVVVERLHQRPWLAAFSGRYSGKRRAVECSPDGCVRGRQLIPC